MNWMTTEGSVTQESRITLFTESQNHRMLGVGRDLCGSSSPTPLPKQGHLQQAAQDLVQAGLEYLQRKRIHNLPGQPVPVLSHPQSEEIVPHVQTELPMLQFVPIASCPVTGHHWEGCGPILLTPTLKMFISIYKVPSQPSLLQAKQAQLPQPFLIIWHGVKSVSVKMSKMCPPMFTKHPIFSTEWITVQVWIKRWKREVDIQQFMAKWIHRMFPSAELGGRAILTVGRSWISFAKFTICYHQLTFSNFKNCSKPAEVQNSLNKFRECLNCAVMSVPVYF